MIRDFNADTDMRDLRNCMMQLQDFERSVDGRIPSGQDIVDDYIPGMLFKCRAFDGKILVSETDGVVSGYVMVLARMRSDELQDGDYEYGLVSDLVVDHRYRGQGLGRELLEAAESWVRSKNIGVLRIGVYAENRVARDLYAASGFSEFYVEFEKNLSNP